MGLSSVEGACKTRSTFFSVPTSPSQPPPRRPLSDTALMEMSHTTGLYPWDPDDEVGPAVEEGIIVSGPQIMAYVHMVSRSDHRWMIGFGFKCEALVRSFVASCRTVARGNKPLCTSVAPAAPYLLMAPSRSQEQLLPCLEGLGSPQLFRLPCRPSQPASLLAFPSLAKFVLVVDWNTVRGEWLGRLTAPLSADSIGGTQCRLSTGHAERRDGVAGLALELPGSTVRL